MSLNVTSYFTKNFNVGNSAVGFGEMVRTTIFSEELRRLFCERKELELAFRLDFLFLFHQGKRKVVNNKIQFFLK